MTLLSGPDEDARNALRAGDVDPGTAASALDAVTGVGGWTRTLDPEAVAVSPRVEHILEEAARDAGQRGEAQVQNKHVLRALLISDDPAVGRLVVQIVGSSQRILDALASGERTD